MLYDPPALSDLYNEGGCGLGQAARADTLSV